MLLARIDRLPEAPRRLLQTAAVLGRDFSVRLLGAIWQEQGDVEPVLRELTRLEFLVPQSGGEEPGYRFKHALTQEARLREPRPRPARGAPCRFLLSRGRTFVGDHDAAVSSAERALQEATGCGDEATMGKALCVLAVERHWTGESRRGIEEARRAAALLTRTGERYWLAQAYRALGLNYGLEGEFDLALEAEAQAYAIAEAIGDPQLQCYSMWTTGWFEAKRGEWAAGIRACRRGLERSPDPGTTAIALGFLGVAHLEQGDAAQAIPLLEESARRLRELGLQREEGWLLVFLADAYRASGRLEPAGELARRGLEMARARQSWPGVGRAQRVLGRIAQASGARAEALRYLQEALRTFASVGARFEAGRTHLALAELVQTEGKAQAAAAHAAEARRLFEALRVPRYVERAEGVERRPLPAEPRSIMHEPSIPG